MNFKFNTTEQAFEALRVLADAIEAGNAAEVLATLVETPVVAEPEAPVEAPVVEEPAPAPVE